MGMRMHREMSGAENGYEKVGNGYEDIERKWGGDRLSMIGRRCERNGSIWVCE